MADSPILGITYLVDAQDQAEIKVNDAINKLETATQISVKDKDLTSPPGSPADGDCYIVAAGATGAWAGKDNNIALYYSGWLFIVPVEGFRAWVQDEDALYVFDGTGWDTFQGDGLQFSLNQLTIKPDGGTLAVGAAGLKVADSAGLSGTQLAAATTATRAAVKQAAAVADLNQTIAGPTIAEVQAISDKVDELLAALRTAGQLA